MDSQNYKQRNGKERIPSQRSFRKAKLNGLSDGLLLAIPRDSRDCPKNGLVENIARCAGFEESSHRTILDGQVEEKWIRQMCQNDSSSRRWCRRVSSGLVSAFISTSLANFLLWCLAFLEGMSQIF